VTVVDAAREHDAMALSAARAVSARICFGRSENIDHKGWNDRLTALPGTARTTHEPGM
jgi:hypothetical protein